MRTEIFKDLTRDINTAPRGKGEADGANLASLFTSQDGVRHVMPGGTLFLHGDRAESLYQVVSGTLACCSISIDGRRQIFSFAQKGDVLGLSELDRWHYTGQAVDHVIVRAASRARAEAQTRKMAGLQRAVQASIAHDMAAREQHMITLAYLPAEDRLRLFLENYAASRRSTGYVVLPMTRQDIGDHLGLTLETVSRAFGALRRKGLIEMRGSDRFCMVFDQPALAA